MQSIEKRALVQQLCTSKEGQEYLELVSRVQTENRGIQKETGYEIHHIHPVSLGGTNKNSNKVKFTTFEHCKAHALLAKALPNCPEMLFTINRLSDSQVKKLSDLDQISLEEIYKWSELRDKALHMPRSQEVRDNISVGIKNSEAFKQACQNREPCSPETKEKIGNALRNHFVSEETKQKISRALTGKKRGPLSEKAKKAISEKNRGKVRSKEVRERISRTLTGRVSPRRGIPLTEEHKRKISEATKGRVSPNKGKKYSDELRQKLSQAHKGKPGNNLGKHQSLEARKKMSEQRQGCVWITDGKQVRRVSKEEGNKLIGQGWERGRKVQKKLIIFYKDYIYIP